MLMCKQYNLNKLLIYAIAMPNFPKGKIQTEAVKYSMRKYQAKTRDMLVVQRDKNSEGCAVNIFIDEIRHVDTPNKPCKNLTN